ncbi:uncharacterized protein METZ01_LOCUS391027, partial [marine metagenome]
EDNYDHVTSIELIIGHAVLLASYNFEETDDGWTVGDVDDDATAGIWEPAIPVATFFDGNQAQPGTDQSEDGEKCFLTGAATSPGSVGFDDVDGGKTTLLSPIFDLSEYTEALITYYRWYTNNVGDNPGTDHWQADVSDNDGESWSALEYTTESNDSWIQKNFLLSQLGVTLTNQVQFRFVAEDINNPEDRGSGGSIIEAAIDDFTISTFETNNYQLGDVNLDSVVNILDIVIIVNYILGQTEFTPLQESLADMNGDGMINILDVIQLVNGIAPDDQF